MPGLVRNAITVALLATVCLAIRPDAIPAPGVSLRMRRLPARTLWAWERPENLGAIDPATTAIAWLDQTILLGKDVTGVPRRQGLIYPPNVTRIAVVRIEALPGAILDASARSRTADLLLLTASRPGIAALQVDFDATRSQRAFYAQLLGELRQRMPVSMPLSITALASWCSNDDWIHSLPVDEAVPMFFRMEPDRQPAASDLGRFRIREPKCMGSAGISATEPWPARLAGKRLYFFSDRGWREDLNLLNDRKIP